MKCGCEGAFGLARWLGSGRHLRSMCITFVFFATLYHIWPGAASAVAVLIVSTTTVMLFPNLLVWIVSYGYLAHTVLVSGPHLPIVFQPILFVVPVIVSQFVKAPGTVTSGQVCMRPVVMMLCCALCGAMFVSHFADPVRDGQGEFLAIRVLSVLLCVLVSRTIRSEQDVWLSMLAFAATSSFLALYYSFHAATQGAASLYEFVWEESELRDPNYLALYLCYGIAPLAVISMQGCLRRGVFWRAVSFVCLLAVLWAVVLTNSRMGSVLAASALVLTVLRRFASGAKAVVVSMCVASGLLLVMVPLVSTLPAVVELQRRWNLDDVATAGGRLEYWQQSMKSFERANAGRSIFGAGSEAARSLVGEDPHNTYFEFLLDHGLIGLGLLVSLLAVASVNAVRTRSAPIASALWPGLMIMTVGSMVLSPFVRTWSWIVVAPFLVSRNGRAEGGG